MPMLRLFESNSLAFPYWLRRFARSAVFPNAVCPSMGVDLVIVLGTAIAIHFSDICASIWRTVSSAAPLLSAVQSAKAA